MTRLFRHADPTMPEKKIVRLVMRGVKQELFAGLMRNPSNRIQGFVSEATTIQKTLDMRNQHYNRCSMPHLKEIQGICSNDHHETIKAILQEELRKFLPSSQRQLDSIADVVRQEIQQLLGTPEPLQPQPQAMSYAAAARR